MRMNLYMNVIIIYFFFVFLSPLKVFSECLVLSIETNVLNLLESWTASFFFFLFFCSVCFRGVLLLVVVSASLLQLSLLCMSLYLFFFFLRALFSLGQWSAPSVVLWRQGCTSALSARALRHSERKVGAVVPSRLRRRRKKATFFNYYCTMQIVRSEFQAQVKM